MCAWAHACVTGWNDHKIKRDAVLKLRMKTQEKQCTMTIWLASPEADGMPSICDNSSLLNRLLASCSPSPCENCRCRSTKSTNPAQLEARGKNQTWGCKGMQNLLMRMTARLMNTSSLCHSLLPHNILPAGANKNYLTNQGDMRTPRTESNASASSKKIIEGA